MIIAYIDPPTQTMSIMTCFHREPGWSDDQMIGFHSAKLPAHTNTWRVLHHEDELPEHVEYQGAWQFDLTQDRAMPIVVNMPKAREIHRELLRQIRSKHLANLDLEVVKQLHEPGAQLSADLRAYRQYLLDITDDPRIAAAQSTAELRAIQINSLGRSSSLQAHAISASLPPPEEPVEEPLPAPPRPLPPAPPLHVEALANLMPQPAPSFKMGELLQRATDEMQRVSEIQEIPLGVPDPLSQRQAFKGRQMPAMPLSNAEATAVILTDSELRDNVRVSLDLAILKLAAGTNQVRYELAMQTRNGNVDAAMMLKDEADAWGQDVQGLANQIVAERALIEQRTMQAYAIRARTIRDVATMVGGAITEIGEKAAKEIRGL